MLRRTEMIALPIKRKLLHKCCVIYTPNTGHPVLGVHIYQVPTLLVRVL